MKRLYCPECGEYLEGGDGEMRDCLCGWNQPIHVIEHQTNLDEIESLQSRIAELESQLAGKWQPIETNEAKNELEKY